MNTVSILINNYNYGRFLGDAIDSALAQSQPADEIIVVDDGSTDDSRQVIEGYGARITPLFKKNGGQASAFNAGFAKSRGDIILLLDSDDAFVPDKVARVQQIFERQGEAEWLMHPLHHTDGDLLTSADRRASEADQRPGSESGMRDVREPLARGRLGNALCFDGTATSGLCYRRALLAQILPMPEDRVLYDDFIKFPAMAMAPGYVLNEPLAQQRLHGGNLMTERNDREALHLAALINGACYWRQRLPAMLPFAETIFASSLGQYRAVGGDYDWLEPKVRAFLAATPLSHKPLVSARIAASWLMRKANHKRLRT